MSSAYGVIPRPAGANPEAVSALLPAKTTLKDATPVVLQRVDPTDLNQLKILQEMLNFEIVDGRTYPQEAPMDLAQFKTYFLAYDAFVLETVDKQVVGTFYVKPNFPGRCSHVCNGGFITHEAWRGRGAGTILCDYFLKIAPLLGYRQSMFNLVFANNVASVGTWRKRGFQELGRVPGAGRLKKYENGQCVGEEYVDAIMFGFQFHQ